MATVPRFIFTFASDADINEPLACEIVYGDG
jgi:hypothetical protein